MIAGLVIAIPTLWWNHIRAHVFRCEISPDGSWSVTVLRQKDNVIPFTEGINVTVQVEDAAGNLLTRRVIDNVDIWSDVDDKYPDITIDDERIRIGPGYWDGEKRTYFELTKNDLEERATR